MYHYTIPEIPPSNNKFIGRENRWEYQEVKKLWARLVAVYCRPKPPKPLERATITLEYHFKDKRRRDPDNYSGKMILDGLTAAGIIADDSFLCIDLQLKAVYDGRGETRVFIAAIPQGKELLYERTESKTYIHGGNLGSALSNSEIHKEFIASKAPNAKTIEEEVAAVGVEEVVEKSMTVFPKLEDGTPFIYDYQVRGFFKEACSCLKKVEKTRSSKIKAFKKQIDGLVFVAPRKIPMDMHGGTLGTCQRPLRASTALGERISLANSEVAPEGTTIEFTVKCLVDDDIETVKEWLEYGIFKGLGSGETAARADLLLSISIKCDGFVRSSSVKRSNGKVWSCVLHRMARFSFVRRRDVRYSEAEAVFGSVMWRRAQQRRSVVKSGNGKAKNI